MVTPRRMWHEGVLLAKGLKKQRRRLEEQHSSSWPSPFISQAFPLLRVVPSRMQPGSVTAGVREPSASHLSFATS